MSLDDLGPHDIDTEAIELDYDGHAIEAWHARPEGMPIGGLVVIPDVGGLRPLFHDHAARLASWGLAVIVIEPFFTLAPEDRGADLDARLAQVKDFDDELVIGATETAADWLVVHDDAPSVAVIGFCMGGMYAMKVASAGRFDHAIAVYGMPHLPEYWKSPTHQDPIAMIDAASNPSPLLAIFGTEDALVPMEWVDDLRAALTRVPKSEVVVYEGGEHGFVHDPSRPTHRADDARDVWRRVFTVLGIERTPSV